MDFLTRRVFSVDAGVVMKIALYQRDTYQIVHVVNEWIEASTDYIRLTEAVDVEFAPLPYEILIPQKLAALDEAEKELTAKHLTALDAIKSRRKDLLALAPPKAVEAA